MSLGTLHRPMLAVAAHTPDRPAVYDGTREISYGELDEQSGRFASALLELGVAPGERVALAMAKTVDAVAALYGVLRIGAAHVPVTDQWPAARTAAIVTDAGCRVGCADTEKGAAVLSDAGLVLVSPGDLGTLEPSRVDQGCESDLAYVLYTSGSTGRPKGVMLTHRNGSSFVEWAVQRFGIGAHDRLSNHAPFHFDLSVFDLHGAVAAGASMHLVPPDRAMFGAELAALVRERALTVWYSTPSALVKLIDAADPGDLDSLRVVLFAGEPMALKHLRRLRKMLPSATLANLYGPTETNVCTYHVVPESLPDDLASVPIGRSCENQEVLALDEHNRPVGVGEAGELWVRGPTVMKGYLGEPEASAASLCQNPTRDVPDVVYRTGDLVRLRTDGQFDFLGRRDHQVKSRGFRIELGEIEARLTSHPSVRHAVVVAVPDDDLGNRLVGFVETIAVDDAPQPIELKRYCAEALPRYMIPAPIEIVDRIPLTTTGKTDRLALLALVDRDDEDA